MNETELAPFEEVARLVAGADAPPWLADHLKRWAPSISIDRVIETRQPGRAEMRKLLVLINDAAMLVKNALAQPAIREFLEAVPGGPMENIGMFDRSLRDLAERSERASSLPALTNKAGKTKAGRGRAMPPSASSSQAYCAALIAETWDDFHDRYPAPTNHKAAEAADAYWRACEKYSKDADWRKAFGEELRGWGSDPLNRWRPYFKAAKPPALAAERAEYLRHLRQAERQWKMLQDADAD